MNSSLSVETLKNFQEASPESSTLQESWDDSNDYGDDFIPPETSGSLKIKVFKRGGKLYRVWRLTVTLISH